MDSLPIYLQISQFIENDECGVYHAVCKGSCSRYEFAKAILEYLGINSGKTVSAEELVEHVWESDTDLFSVSVKVHMSKLRKKLEDVTGKNYIETIRGRGYLLSGE